MHAIFRTYIVHTLWYTSYAMETVRNVCDRRKSVLAAVGAAVHTAWL